MFDGQVLAQFDGQVLAQLQGTKKTKIGPEPDHQFVNFFGPPPKEEKLKIPAVWL